MTSRTDHQNYASYHFIKAIAAWMDSFEGDEKQVAIAVALDRLGKGYKGLEELPDRALYEASFVNLMTQFKDWDSAVLAQAFADYEVFLANALSSVDTAMALLIELGDKQDEAEVRKAKTAYLFAMQLVKELGWA